MTSLLVNARTVNVDASIGTSLLTILRDTLHLAGARYGCGRGECGACVVLVDGQPVPACVTTIESLAGKAITTIEGLATGDRLHPVQQAFADERALQCGYCTPAMILGAVALLDKTPHPTDAEIRDALAPHLCRCGVYLRAIRAVHRAAETAATPARDAMA